jgi:hypothetical protein
MPCKGIAVLIFAAAAALTPVAAHACTGTALFEDAFASLDSGWGDGAGGRLKVADGKATISLPANALWWVWNSGWAFPAAVDLCVDATTLSDTADPVSSAAGLVFWVKDNGNFYVFNVSSAGTYWISRLLDGKWAKNPADAVASPDIRKGPNQTNSLRVKSDGANVAFFINGKEQTKLKLQPPGKSSYVGLFGQSAVKSADSWEFTKLKVTEPN